MICVLSLSSPAVSSEGGFFDLPRIQAQCCFTANSRYLIAGPLVTLGARAKLPDRSYNLIIDGSHTYAAMERGIGDLGTDLGHVIQDDSGTTDMTVAGGTAPVESGASANKAPAKDDTPEKSDTPTPDAPADATADATGGEFSGSPQPAGPDLTATQEKDLISSGWK
jgi:hypothetical protein